MREEVTLHIGSRFWYIHVRYPHIGGILRTLHTTTIERIRELRNKRAMTQQGLAERLNLLGARIDRTAIAKIESGDRQLTLTEAFQFAWALNVAPVHLFVPTDDDKPIRLGAQLEASPRRCASRSTGNRRCIRSGERISRQSPRTNSPTWRKTDATPNARQRLRDQDRLRHPLARERPAAPPRRLPHQDRRASLVR